MARWKNLRKTDAGLVNDVVSKFQHWQNQATDNIQSIKGNVTLQGSRSLYVRENFPLNKGKLVGLAAELEKMGDLFMRSLRKGTRRSEGGIICKKNMGKRNH